MNINAAISKTSKVGAVAVMLVGLLGSPLSVFADGAIYNPGTLVSDHFENLYYRPDSRAYWYVENRGYQDGQDVNTRETPCANQTCVHLQNDGGDNFLRLEVHAHPYAGYFTLANLSELEDGLGGNNNADGAWTPTVGHPVTLTTKIRFAPNMKVDGTGGASGSAGVVLWNNPYSPSATNQGPGQNLIGYGWSYAGADLKGFYATVAQQTFPIFIDPLFTVNMQKWNTYKFVWSVDVAGVQTVNFYINDLFIGASPVPGFQNLSVEVWVDNQQLTFTGINDVAVPQGDYMDVNYIKVTSN